MNLIHAWFENQVAQNPEKTAIIDGTRFITYRDLNACANHLAIRLLQAGATSEMRIGLCFSRSIEQLIAILAILKSGNTYVPLDRYQSQERLLALLEECEASLLVTSADAPPWVDLFRGTRLNLNSINPEPLSANELSILEKIHQKADEHHLAYIMFTSGSTGKPKGVMVEHLSIIHYCAWFADYTRFSQDFLVDYSSHYIFDFSITNSIAPLMLGATLVICSDEIRKHPPSYLQFLEKNQINLISITPSFFKELIYASTQHRGALSHLKKIIIGGEALSASDCRIWLDRFKHHHIFNEYGPTETTVAVTCYPVTHATLDHSLSTIPIGKSGPTMNTFLLDTQLKPVQPGTTGELYIGGTCVARGYLNQPALTEQNFIQHLNSRLYKTGDLCKLNPAGDLEYLGRIDKQIKIRGYRVELKEIEIRLSQHPSILDTVVTVRVDLNTPKLVAYYILKSSASPLSFVELQKYLLIYLPDYMIPNAFVQIDAFPLTANDKVDEGALPAPTMLSAQVYKAPNTQTEKLLAQIWAEEFQLTHIGILDNFFELGGHSLTAARIIAKIAQKLGKKISLPDLYQAPTIDRLALIIKQAPPVEIKEAASIHQEKRSLPLHDFQLLFWLSRLWGPKLQVNNLVWRRRVQGQIDKAALDLALQWVLKKQEIFSYHIHLWYPLQTPCAHPHKQIRAWRETSLRHLPESVVEPYIAQHSDALFYKKTWRNKSLWISADLFYLPHEQVELQVCVSHMLVDESCQDLFFQTLSQAYLFFTKHTQTHHDHTLQPYQKYITQHHAILHENASSAENFWSDYLRDAGSFHFPKQYLSPQNEVISTQIALSDHFVEKLQPFCAQHNVAINDLLCATVSIALLHCCDNDLRCAPHDLVLFATKSTRHDPQYDHTIGCFLRVDPIKLTLSQDATLVDLAKQAQHSALIGAPFQEASTLIKYAAVGKLQSCLSRNPLKKLFFNQAFSLIAKHCHELGIAPSLLSACNFFAILDQTKRFLVNINMPKNFLEDISSQQPPHLLGLLEAPIPHHPFRNPAVKYLLDIYFHRSTDHNTRYIVLTSNLNADFQRRLGNKIASLIEHC